MCRFLAVFLWLAILPSAYAKDAGDLYRAQAIVTGTEEPERTRGFRSGLIDVLIKLTGDARLANEPALKPILARPHPLISHFDYEDRMKDIPIHDEQGTRERPHFLRMQFHPGKIDEVLRTLGLSKWPPDRPALAVWMGVKNAVSAFVLTSDGDEGYGQRAVLKETADLRGLPLVMPSSTGKGRDITFDEIASQNVSRLRMALPDADAYLSGVLAVTEKGYWRITWRLDWKGLSRIWSLDDVSFDTAIRNGLETAALVLSGKDQW